MNLEALPARLRDALAFALRAIVDGCRRPANRVAPPPPSSCAAVVRYCPRRRSVTGRFEVGEWDAR